MSENYAVWQVRRSRWAKSRLNEPWAVQMIYPDFPPKEYPELRVLTLGEVLDLAEEKELASRNAYGFWSAYGLTGHVSHWMKALGLGSLYALERAALALSRDQRLDLARKLQDMPPVQCCSKGGSPC